MEVFLSSWRRPIYPQAHSHAHTPFFAFAPFFCRRAFAPQPLQHSSLSSWSTSSPQHTRGTHAQQQPQPQQQNQQIGGASAALQVQAPHLLAQNPKVLAHSVSGPAHTHHTVHTAATAEGLNHSTPPGVAVKPGAAQKTEQEQTSAIGEKPGEQGEPAGVPRGTAQGTSLGLGAASNGQSAPPDPDTGELGGGEKQKRRASTSSTSSSPSSSLSKLFSWRRGSK